MEKRARRKAVRIRTAKKYLLRYDLVIVVEVFGREQFGCEKFRHRDAESSCNIEQSADVAAFAFAKQNVGYGGIRHGALS